MKRSIQLILTLSLVILFYSLPSNVKAEANTEWKLWPTQPDAVIYKEWEIKFSDAVDSSSIYSDNITVVRERDNKKMGVSPDILGIEKNIVKVGIHELFDFDETYNLYIKDVKSINGDVLKEPIKMKFQTEKVEFNVNKQMEQDGLRFEATLGQTVDNLYANVKVTNVSTETIPYWGSNSCDKGLSSSVVSKDYSDKMIDLRKWSKSTACFLALYQYYLNPGDSVEIFDVLFLPEQPLNENNDLQVRFQRGNLADRPSPYPVKVEIPIELK